MRADLSTCQQIQCGAITQDQAGADLLLACSEAGYVGARACADSLCSPYITAMRANGECPSYSGDGGDVISMLAQPIYMPKPTTQTMPRIIDLAKKASGGVMPGSQIYGPDTILNPMPRIVTAPAEGEMAKVCSTFASWVDTNPLLATLGLVGLYFLLTGVKK